MYLKISTNKKNKQKISVHCFRLQRTKKGKNGKVEKIKQNVDEQQVIFWSADYAKHVKAERQPAIDKARDLIGNVQKYNKKNSVGASKYVKQLIFDKSTGEIIEAKSQLSLDEDKIAEEEKLDVYYMIVSSEFDKTPDEIIDIYRDLWRIEETFKVTKSELDARPVYVSRKEHIEAHFLTCYIALVLSRILQHKLDQNAQLEKSQKVSENVIVVTFKKTITYLIIMILY